MGYRVGPIGDGTVSGTSGTKAVTGSSSAFNTQFQSGDTIVLIDSSGNHDAYVVDTVTNDTSLSVTTNLSENYSAVSYYGQRDADDLFTLAGRGEDPASVYRPGSQSVIVGDGTLLWRGYPVVTWRYGWMTVAQWTALKTYITNGAYSAECYVETRDDEDSYSRYQAVARFPDPSTLQRWGSRYMDVVIEFALVDAVA